MKGSRIIPLAATAALAVGGTLAVAPAAHADWYGTIVGKVLNADGTPAHFVTVSATGADDGNPATNDGSGEGTTDRNGVYRINFIQRNNTYAITVDGTTLPAQNATGTAGAVTSGPTFTLPAPTPTTPAAPPSTYAAVIAVTGGYGPENTVRAFDAASGQSYTADYASDGRYYFATAPAGSYKIFASGADGHGDFTGAIWSGNAHSKRDAAVVSIGSSTNLGSLTIPANYSQGSVTGTIGVPRVPGFQEWYGRVTFTTAEGDFVTRINTDAAGNYSIDLPTGTYYAYASGSADQVSNFDAVLAGTTAANPSRVLASYATALQWYGGTTQATAKKIVVTANGTTSAINFALSNSLKPIVKPTIKGKFKKGKRISVTTGTWNKSSNVTYAVVWKEGSTIVGTTPSLKLSKKIWKKVRKLTVVVTATDNGDAVGYDDQATLYPGSVTLPVAKTIKAQVKAAKKQLKQDTKKDNKALHQASAV